MKVSLSWLQEYVSVDIGLQELVDALTMQGLEVESTVDRFDYLENIIVGRVDELRIHPKSSNLSLCVVNCAGKNIDIVCGAKNLTVGMLVPVALHGTVMPSGDVVCEQKIRGYSSYAILCSEHELAVGIDHEGVMSLNNKAIIGQSLKKTLSLSDFVLDIALTPNRPDCSSIIGVAREIRAIQNNKLTCPSWDLIETHNDIDEVVEVDILTPQECPYYSARIFENIEISSSPFWLKDRLNSVGLKPVNNIVDIVNFVMFETGQPLHAFDFDLISGQRIVVDTSKGGEPIKTLDGKRLLLPEGIITIFDSEKPICVAGVIGASKSKVTGETTRVFLESAYFDPTKVRQASKMLDISTESSYRFERGIDPEGSLRALNRAAQLIIEMTNGSMIDGFVNKDFRSSNTEVIINLDIDNVNLILGTSLSLDRVSSLLNSVEFSTERISRKELKVLVPTFRVDVARSEDLIEEVARCYGYKNIPATFPKIDLYEPTIDEVREQTSRMKSILNGLGFSEIINYSFDDVESCDWLNLSHDDYRRKHVKIVNPISSTQSILRTSLIPAFLDTIHRNISRQTKNLMFFELGRVFISNGEDKLPNEIEMLTAACTGLRLESSWSDKGQQSDFFDIKGALEEFLCSFRINNFSFVKLQNASCFYLRPGHSAQVVVSDVILGFVGELDSKLLEEYSIRQKVFIFEVDVKQLCNSVHKFNFLEPIPRFPAVSRDATIIIDETVESAHVLNKVRLLDEKLLEDLYLLDVFRGMPIKSGMKSVSFRIIYRAHNATLDDEIVTRIHKNIINYLIIEFNALLPSSN